MIEHEPKTQVVALHDIPIPDGDKNPGMPLYVRIYDTLYNLIRSDEVREGMQLPSESQLAEHFGMSRGTIRKAMRYLVEDGLLIKGQGRCAEIAPQGKVQLEGLQTYTNACETFCTLPITHHHASWRFTLAGHWLSVQLGIPEGALVLTSDILYYSDQSPVAKSIWLIPAGYLEESSVDPSDEAAMDEFLFDTIQSQVVDTHTDITIAQGAPDWCRDADLVLCLSEIAYGKEAPIGHFKNYLRSDCYRLEMRREGAQRHL